MINFSLKRQTALVSLGMLASLTCSTSLLAMDLDDPQDGSPHIRRSPDGLKDDRKPVMAFVVPMEGIDLQQSTDPENTSQLQQQNNPKRAREENAPENGRDNKRVKSTQDQGAPHQMISLLDSEEREASGGKQKSSAANETITVSMEIDLVGSGSTSRPSSPSPQAPQVLPHMKEQEKVQLVAPQQAALPSAQQPALTFNSQPNTSLGQSTEPNGVPYRQAPFGGQQPYPSGPIPPSFAHQTPVSQPIPLLQNIMPPEVWNRPFPPMVSPCPNKHCQGTPLSGFHQHTHELLNSFKVAQGHRQAIENTHNLQEKTRFITAQYYVNYDLLNQHHLALSSACAGMETLFNAYEFFGNKYNDLVNTFGQQNNALVQQNNTFGQKLDNTIKHNQNLQKQLTAFEETAKESITITQNLQAENDRLHALLNTVSEQLNNGMLAIKGPLQQNSSPQ